MEKLKEFKDKLLALWAKTEPFRNKAGEVIGKIVAVFRKIGYVIGQIGKWIYRLRSVFLTVPVAIAAIRLAQLNMQRLPERVGIYLLSDGTYQWMVERSAAVMCPLGLTAACLFLMFCSRKVVYPWLISIFTLALPWVIYLTNVFPA